MNYNLYQKMNVQNTSLLSFWDQFTREPKSQKEVWK